MVRRGIPEWLGTGFSMKSARNIIVNKFKCLGLKWELEKTKKYAYLEL